MDVNAYFSIKALNQDACITIDFTQYTYVMKLCQASGAQDVLHAEPETAFTQEGYSAHHHMAYDNTLSEKPLVYCDIFLQGLCTDKSILVNSFADASSNNNWTVFNKKFSSGETTKNQDFDKICTISNHRIFIDSQFPVGHPKDPFEKGKIERQLGARLKYQGLQSDYMDHGYPSQGVGSLCGPAAFLYILLKDRPDLYSQYIKDLWNSGKAELGELTITPSEGCCHPVNFTDNNGITRLPSIDWISMASLRDNENIYMSYTSPDDEISGITLPVDIMKWLKGVGAKIISNDMKLFALPKHEIINISNYVGINNHVIVLINHGLLIGKKSSGPTHWVVLESSVKVVRTLMSIDENTLDTELIDFELFSWGESKSLNQFPIGRFITFKEFRTYIYGVIVINKIP